MIGKSDSLLVENKLLNERLDISFALKAARLGIWEFDPATGLISMDEQCRVLFGMAGTGQLSLSYQEIIQHIHPDELIRVDSSVDWAFNLRSGGDFDITFRVIGALDGLQRWVRFVGRGYMDSDLARFAGIAQDMTLDKQQQQQTQSLERFRTMVEQAPVAMALFSGPDFVITLANERVLEYWGRRREQVMHKPLFEALPEASGQGFEELLTGVYTTGERFVAKELPVTLERNGRIELTFIDFVYEPFYELDGAISGITVVCIEITEQVIQRRLVEESEAKIRTLIQEAPVATGLFVGRNLVIEMANELMLSYWGKGQSVIGKPLIEALPELHGQPFLAILDNVFMTGNQHEAKAARADLEVAGVLGSYYFDYTYKPLRNATGEIYGIMNMAVDVTEQVISRLEREAAQTDLLESNQRLGLALDAGRLGSYELDLITGKMTCNAQCKANYGHLPDDRFEFADLLVQVVTEDRAVIDEALAYAFANQENYQAQYRIIWPDGSLHWVKVSGQPTYASDGVPVRINGVTQDITSQRMTQQELEWQVAERTNQLQASIHDLRRSNENLQQFAYIASHDLQEPLRKIQSFGDLLKNQYADRLGNDGIDHLSRIQTAAGRMSTLIRDLLVFSRISTQQDITTIVALNEAVSSVLIDLELSIRETNAIIEVEPLPIVRGDASQLGQLFQNLISNALKFRQKDESGKLMAPRIQITCQPLAAKFLPASVRPTRLADMYYVIDITDKGIGFDEKYTDRIFQVFQRLHSKSDYAGTGIGLAICAKVVANHGGAITARSQPGQGATFSVYLPKSV